MHRGSQAEFSQIYFKTGKPAKQVALTWSWIPRIDCGKQLGAVSPSSRNTWRCCWLLNDLRNDIPNERASECPASLVAFLALPLSELEEGEPPRYLNFPKRRRWLNISPPDMNSSTMYRLVLS